MSKMIEEETKEKHFEEIVDRIRDIQASQKDKYLIVVWDENGWMDIAQMPAIKLLERLDDWKREIIDFAK